MGNQITSTAPTQILPLESYFNELQEYGKPHSLGSTRFLKVARTTHKSGGEVVVKIFPKHDTSIQLGKFEKELDMLRRKLHGVPNALPFLQFWVADKAAFLVRQYARFNLYDRLSTRPFLNTMQKKWIAFQLLSVVHDCHSRKIIHGDIKSQNVLLTGWDWVLLTDFASFKPDTLPSDNPAEYAFFFDTSRKRTCYIAPERFIDDQTNSGVALEPADIFSLGCVIAEMFGGGASLFDLSSLLEYRNGENPPSLPEYIKKIEDKGIRRLVRHMIQKNPKDRLKAYEYQQIYRKVAFPDCFYNFLFQYFVDFTKKSFTSPDEKLQQLHTDMDNIITIVIQDGEVDEDGSDAGDILVIILSAITSFLRVAKFAKSKLQALEMMKKISHHVTDHCIVERIVPFLVHLSKDQSTRVRADSVRLLAYCLSRITNLPRSDANLFPGYIFPQLNSLVGDPEVAVRVAYAESLASLAETSQRFLELSQHIANQSADDAATAVQLQAQGSYDTELASLRDSIQSKVVNIFSDQENVVKRALVESDIIKLCRFFGQQKTKDVLLSHMITFLNDKIDWQLHGLFFDAIVDIASYVGWQGVSMLRPLLDQGLSDPEETVVCKALEAITVFCEQHLFDHQRLLEVFTESIPFLCHPNIWIRYGCVGLVCAVARQLDNVDVLCYLLPKLELYIRQPIIQIREEAMLLSVLKDPLPRALYDYVLKSSKLNEIMECLTDRQIARNLARPGYLVQYSRIDKDLESIFQRMKPLGLCDHHEDQLMALKESMKKVNYARQYVMDVPKSDGVTNLKLHSVSLNEKNLKQFADGAIAIDGTGLNTPSNTGSVQTAKNRRSNTMRHSNTIAVDSNPVNDDWSVMFGEQPTSKSLPPPARRTSNQASPVPERSHDNSSTIKPPTAENLSASTGSITQDSLASPLPATVTTSDIVDYGRSRTRAHKRSRSLEKSANLSTKALDTVNTQAPKSALKAKCSTDLDELLNFKVKQYGEDMQVMELTSDDYQLFNSVSGWSPKGQLIAHFHEHKAAINKIRTTKYHNLYATFSNDGTTKLWDGSKVEGKTLVTKSKLTYHQGGGRVKTGTFCENGSSLACASDDGLIALIKTEPREKSSLYSRQQLDVYNDGYAVEISHFSSGSESVLAFITTMGKIYGWDLRSQDVAWKLSNMPKYGLVTAMTVDPHQNWLALGTSLGYHLIWDMRFQLPIRQWQHTGHGETSHIHRVHALSANPFHHASVISAISGNNEVSTWNMETTTRQKMLWASPLPPFSKMTDDPLQKSSVRCLCVGTIDENMVILFSSSLQPN
ncbi:phosphoinositide 3-kinase regulatory subunit 4-like isoform X2 [Dysidea avara]|uniref:phosphoinositide 3-kinase regulatory subunit 4-like isoform X2 n=1 Tax=Dysidea avara TaxID=196820 RepID=UPI003325F3DC